jgi:hypothetical protein
MSDSDRQPTEEEMRAAYEAQLKALRVEDLVVETVISMLNLGARKAGLAPETEDERDLGQVQTAIEAVRALLPLCEAQLGADAPKIRGALSQLQMAYAQRVQGGDPAPPPPSRPSQPEPEEPEPPPRPSRLWVPGQ